MPVSCAALFTTIVLVLPVFIIASTFSYEDYKRDNAYLGLELVREKRHTEINEDEPGATLRDEDPYWANSTVKTSDHKYYTVSTHEPSEENMKKYWIDVPNNNDNSSYKQLENSYRRAVSAELSFEFPFYGHLTKSMTIATGGFCYVGDHMHSWLAATQYIAPFMANFDTTPDDAYIWYKDTGIGVTGRGTLHPPQIGKLLGEAFVVEWHNVVVRHQTEIGSFTFQCSLHKNGDIWFVYKKIPAPVNAVSDAHHPLKSGLSDAYLFEHNITPMSKKIIYEYHRIEVNMSQISNFTVIELKANPVCIAIKTCEECTNETLPRFNCSWCTVQGHAPFCSDDEGLHRRRQQWINGKCKEQKQHAYCHVDEDTSEIEEIDNDDDDEKKTDDASRPAATPGRDPAQQRNSEYHSPKGMSITKQEVDASSVGSGSLALLVIMLICSITLIAWIVYAYYNPHTASGQLLIRYRPSRWRLGGDHSDVRYTASVHM